MNGQMCWLPRPGDDEKILHLRSHPGAAWKPYTSFSSLAVPDHQIPKGSKGWATYQKLHKAGWKLVPSNLARSIEEAIAS